MKGAYHEQTGLDGLVSFLTEDLSWKGPVNADLLVRVGSGLDTYVLENVYRPKRGSAFAVPRDLWAGPQLIFAIISNWDDGMDDEERVLRRCIRATLELAEAQSIRVLGIPAIGGRHKDYPMAKAARLIITTLREHQYFCLEEIRLICKTDELFAAYKG